MIEAGAVEEYRKRWQVVAALEAAERRDTPMDVRWRQRRSSHSCGLGSRFQVMVILL